MTKTVSTKRRKAVLAAALALVLLFSVCFIALEADHDCHGDDCAVCAQICACMEALRQGVLLLALLLTAWLVLLPAAAARMETAAETQRFSLVSLKVKLSD